MASDGYMQPNKYSTKNKTKVYAITANEGNTLKCFPRLYECEWGLRKKKEKYFEIINFYHHPTRKPTTFRWWEHSQNEKTI